MGTIYLTKTDEWIHPVADKLGRTRFLLLAAVTVTDTTIVANNSYLKSSIFGHAELWIDRVSLMYQGTAGVLLEPVLATGKAPLAYIAVPLDIEITTTTNDEFFSKVLDPPVPLEPLGLAAKTTSGVNFFVLTQSGATASDTLYVLFEGWFR